MIKYIAIMSFVELLVTVKMPGATYNIHKINASYKKFVRICRQQDARDSDFERALNNLMSIARMTGILLEPVDLQMVNNLTPHSEHTVHSMHITTS